MTLTGRLRRQPAFFWIVLAVGSFLFALYPFSVSNLVRAAGVENDVGWAMLRNTDGRLAVIEVDRDGPAAGRLTEGDLLLAFNGHPPLPRGLGWVLFMDLRPGDRYRVRVQHGAASVEHELTVSARSNVQKLWLIQIPLLVVSFSFFVTGLSVALVSARARVARLYATAALLVAALLIPGGVFLGDLLHGRDRGVLLVVATFTPFAFPVIYHFFTEFPPGVPRHAFWHRVTFLLYAWGAAFFPLNALTNLAASRGSQSAVDFIRSHGTMFAISDVAGALYVPAAVVAIAGVIVRNHVAVEDPAQRRRLRWVFLGSIAAATPFALLFVSNLIGSLVGVELEYFAWLRAQTIAQLFLIFLPVTFTYAVLAHRVVGVEVVVRRGLRYLLAKNVLRAAVFFPLVAITVSVVMNPDRTVTQMAVQNPIIAGLAIAAAVGLSARERLNRWLDRRFFRDASERDRLLLDLVHELAQRDDPGRMETLVVERVEQALHPHSVRLVFDDESRWPAASLAIPIPGREGQIIGALLLGDKRSDEPYSREDRRLLEAVAAQIGVVRENASLRRTAADDARVKQEVLARLEPGRFNLLKECPHCGRCYDQSAATCEHDGQALSVAVPVDRTIDGKYRLEQLLGRGGMGAVYAAADLRLARSVAVKLLRDAAFTNEDLRRRFHREARACARLRHDNIITVYDYGTTGYDVAYLVMERLAGSTLRAELRRTGQLTANEVAGWFEQILEGMCCAHAAGVIHRDLKPENVFVRRPDESSAAEITLLDFGLAKLTLDPDQSRSLTTPGAVMGTLAYMSPEQLLGGSVDERTDLFSIGVMALEVVSGSNPFSRAHPQDTVAAILHERTGLSGNDPGSARLDAVIQRCIAKDREQRFASAREMQRELIPALRACTVPGRAHAPAAPGDGASTTA